MTDCEVKDMQQSIDSRNVEIRQLVDERKRKTFYFGLLMVYAIGVSIAVYVSMYQTEYWMNAHRSLKKELITLGYAHYNETNGNWELINK